MNRPHFRRHPRPVDPEPEYSRLDRLDGLPRRDYRHLDKDELAHAAAWLKAHRAPCTDGDVCGEPAHCPPMTSAPAAGGVIATGGTAILDAGERVYPLTRYDGQWPDVLAAEGASADEWSSLPPVYAPRSFVDLPADQSGFTGIADWPVWDYGEGYEIEPEERASEQPAHHPRHAWTPTPPVDEADVAALAVVIADIVQPGAVPGSGARANVTSESLARSLWLAGVRPPAVTP